MFLPQTACLGDNGLPMLFGFIDEYNEPPVVLSSLQEDGTWVSKHYDISSPVSVLYHDGEYLLLNNYGELLRASDGKQKFNFQKLGLLPDGFSALRSVCGRLLALSFNTPPILSDDIGNFISVSGFSLSAPPEIPIDSDPTATLTLEELTLGLAWAAEAAFFYDGVALSPNEFAVTGSHGAVHIISIDGVRQATHQIADRPEMQLTAAYFDRDLGLIVSGADTDTALYTFDPITGHFESVFEYSGLSSLVAISCFAGNHYIANALPAQSGGGIENGLLQLSSNEVTAVRRFLEPVRSCFANASALWVITDIRVSRFDGVDWHDFTLPEYELPTDYE